MREMAVATISVQWQGVWRCWLMGLANVFEFGSRSPRSEADSLYGGMKLPGILCGFAALHLRQLVPNVRHLWHD